MTLFKSFLGPRFTGAVNASSAPQPLMIRWPMVRGFKPVSFAQSCITIDFPNAVRKTLSLLLRHCSEGVAHRQLSLQYGPSLSGKRSMVCLGDGRGLMSDRKAVNEYHSGQMVIPRPPYRRYPGSTGDEQRRCIASQERYSGRAEKGNPVAVLFLFAYFWQPHDDVLPLLKFPSGNFVSFPQSHRHNHTVFLNEKSRSIAVSHPNFSPVTSSGLIGGILTWQS